jgi:hypothetical protein
MRFTRSDWLGLLGILFTIAFGALSLQYSRQPLPSRFVLAAIAVLFLLSAFLLLWLPNRPPWTVLEHVTSLRIHDPAGTRATLTKTVRLRCNRPGGQQHFMHRNISSDGPLAFECDGGVTSTILKGAGDYTIEVRFRAPVGFLEVVETSLQLECRNCFTTDIESLTVLADSPIKRASVEIHFPPDRLPRDPRGVYRYMGKEEQFPVAWEGRLLRWTSANRLFGLKFGEYDISWRW